MEQNEVAIQAQQQTGVSIYSDANTFEHAQRMCKMLVSSTLVPKEYQNNLPNALIAYEMSVRTGMSVFMVMQNLDVIQGRPSWNSKYVIAALNSCGRFSPLQFEYKDLGPKTVQYFTTSWHGQQKQRVANTIQINDRSCVAIARDATGKEIRGPVVTLEMAVREGWYTKTDSKWPTMPDVMLSYRSAKFFGNLYAPDVLMGMMSSDEIVDIGPSGLTPAQGTVTPTSSPVQVLNEKLNAGSEQAQNTTSQPVEEAQVVQHNDEDLV